MNFGTKRSLGLKAGRRCAVPTPQDNRPPGSALPTQQQQSNNLRTNQPLNPAQLTFRLADMPQKTAPII
ncbi:hypothetical protein [Pseudomonas turukhanskensis]|uniref:Uncharacterized protein n=1 Tax=Pseudomonas turukhanskensis TaxID=1806536 RepID=A0A9W6NDZ1_9PSED|nr:hypothetical protein [Pseudomonas turukhanskensis]GLK88119.1 hypothetical protein GCM10017655_11810 [Pseudomonas turukhanskensis]